MHAELLQRIDALSREIRTYPTPIARCDLHLPALIEERAALVARLRRLEDEGPCGPDAVWANDGGPAH